MSSPSVLLPFPTGRTLASWWAQLAGRHPTGLWVAHLHLHRLEALAGSPAQRPLTPWDRALLSALSLWPERTIADLAATTALGPSLLETGLEGLRMLGLATQAGQAWALTETGRQALANGSYAAIAYERRVFYFVERGDLPPHFLPIQPTLPQAQTATPGGCLEASLVQDCLDRSPEWKQRYGFPTEVSTLLIGPSGVPALEVPDWQRIALDWPQRLSVALVRCADKAGECLIAFPVRADGWALQTDQPAFVLPGDGSEVFPDLAQGPSEAELRQAWQSWAQPRGGQNIQPERLLVEGNRLRVEVRPRAMERLRSARADLNRGDGWALVGQGRIRCALLFDLVALEKDSEVVAG